MKKTKKTFYAIIGPSGCGKGSVISALKKMYPNFFYPISFTSRPKRENEKNGVTYHFVSLDEFKNKIQNRDFLEYQLIHNQHYYGTDKKSILEEIKTKNIIREIDYQGFIELEKNLKNKNLVSIFITTKTWEELKKRIISRDKIKESDLKEREKSYHLELEFAKTCDHTIYNKENELQKTVESIAEIINTNKL